MIAQVLVETCIVLEPPESHPRKGYKSCTLGAHTFEFTNCGRVVGWRASIFSSGLEKRKHVATVHAIHAESGLINEDDGMRWWHGLRKFRRGKAHRNDLLNRDGVAICVAVLPQDVIGMPLVKEAWNFLPYHFCDCGDAFQEFFIFLSPAIEFWPSSCFLPRLPHQHAVAVAGMPPPSFAVLWTFVRVQHREKSAASVYMANAFLNQVRAHQTVGVCKKQNASRARACSSIQPATARERTRHWNNS